GRPSLVPNYAHASCSSPIAGAARPPGGEYKGRDRFYSRCNQPTSLVGRQGSDGIAREGCECPLDQTPGQGQLVGIVAQRRGAGQRRVGGMGEQRLADLVPPQRLLRRRGPPWNGRDAAQREPR